MKKTVKIAFALILVLTFALSLCACSTSDDKTVRVYNWGDYIDTETIKMFEEETGYKVTYVTFDTNETMYTKLISGNTSYDVIVPSDYMIEKLISEDRLAEIDMNNVPNFANVNDEFKGLSYDPEDKYSVAYMWGTMGILYNKDMVDEPVTSWRILFDEKYDDNIMMYNSSRDSIGITLKMLGYDLNSTDEKELEEAKEVLIRQTSLVSAYVVDDVKDKMIGNEAALALAWAGDAVYCMSENESLDYVIPEEGSNIFFDSMCIPKNCKNKAGAEAFINFMCRPDISAMNALYIGYSTPIDAAREHMGEDGNNPVAYPDVTKYDLQIFSNVGSKTKLYDQIWTEVMASIDE